ALLPPLPATLLPYTTLFRSTILGSQGPMQAVTIAPGEGGALHQTGDSIAFSSATGTGATGTVTEIADNSSVEFYIVDGGSGYSRSEEHTSELQSRENLVCRL